MMIRRCFYAAILTANFLLHTMAAQTPDLLARANRWINGWNELCTSISANNETYKELNDLVHKQPPPWRTINDPAQLRRRELYAEAIANAQAQIKALETLAREDR